MKYDNEDHQILNPDTPTTTDKLSSFLTSDSHWESIAIGFATE